MVQPSKCADRQNRLLPCQSSHYPVARMPTLKTEENSKFQHEVLEVNKEFAEHYSESYQQGGFEAVSGVSPAPKTSWNPNPVKPTIGKNVLVEEFARIVGDVRLAATATWRRRSSIRADEGSPIIVGEKLISRVGLRSMHSNAVITTQKQADALK